MKDPSAPSFGKSVTIESIAAAVVTSDRPSLNAQLQEAWQLGLLHTHAMKTRGETGKTLKDYLEEVSRASREGGLRGVSLKTLRNRAALGAKIVRHDVTVEKMEAVLEILNQQGKKASIRNVASYLDGQETEPKTEPNSNDTTGQSLRRVVDAGVGEMSCTIIAPAYGSPETLRVICEAIEMLEKAHNVQAGTYRTGG